MTMLWEKRNFCNLQNETKWGTTTQMTNQMTGKIEMTNKNDNKNDKKWQLK